MNSTDAGSRPAYPRVMLAAAGVAVAVVILLSRGLGAPWAAVNLEFAGWMALSVTVGGILRGLRRKAFFGPRLSLHQAISYDAIFQAAILFNPQLPYPEVESEFLARHMGSTPETVAPWFRVREAAALAIPLSLGFVIAALNGRALAAALFIAAGVAWVAYRCAAVPREVRPPFLVAILLGIGASVSEGLLFTVAARSISPGTESWSAFLLYGVLLAAFELSPAPFTLGVLEIAWLCVSMIPGVHPPGLVMAESYRVFRAVPVLLLAIFYLPRYKMAIRDLYDVRLPMALARTRRKPEASQDASGPALSIVLPAYNEVERLPRYLPNVIEYCSGVAGGGEVLVVDDGSGDGTAGYVESLALKLPVLRLVRQPRNMGKGAAVRRGVLESKGKYILFADADGATPIDECSKLLQAAEDGADVVIGSRKVAGDSVQRDRSMIREFIGSTFYRITNLLAVPGISDTQCGFKLFRRDAARRIFPELQETGWAFDVEILFLAQKFGLVIDEVPVNWTAVEGSKVRPKDAFHMLVALLRIRRRSAGLTTSPSSFTAH